jgi:hypothetical protein
LDSQLTATLEFSRYASCQVIYLKLIEFSAEATPECLHLQPTMVNGVGIASQINRSVQHIILK